MEPNEIPHKLIDILDKRAGKKHSRDGSVVNTLAEILTAYQEIIRKTKYLCPQCGAIGVGGGYSPLCDVCDYKVAMVQVSDRVYNMIGRSHS